MARLKININPEILKWAREEAGYTIDEISQKLDVTAEDYSLWEKNGEGLPFGKFKKIANYYKRQIATFFLPEVPEKLKKPKDFRNFDPLRARLSKEVLLVMRRVDKFREFAVQEKGQKYWKDQYEWQSQIENETDDNLFKLLRDTLDIDLEKQLAFKSNSDAYLNWRNGIEKKLGILVFQFSMPFEEVQGFCYSDYFPYAIVVNSKHSYTGRIFTLFHELAHILKHQSGICTPEFVDKSQELEFSCNSFAGRFLIPENTLVPTDDLEEVKKYSNKLKISREVYLRRMYEEQLVEPVRFFSLLDDIKKSYRNVKTNEKKSFGIPKPVISKAQRGETFYNMVLEGVNNNRITYSAASELLGLKMNALLSEV